MEIIISIPINMAWEFFYHRCKSTHDFLFKKNGRSFFLKPSHKNPQENASLLSNLEFINSQRKIYDF